MSGKNKCKILKEIRQKIVVRIPLIPGFNTEDHQKKSMEFFSSLGLNNFDLFTYNEYLT